MKISLDIELMNVPKYAENAPYIVAREDETDSSVYWFYGAWDDKAKADSVALELGETARVFENK